MHREVVCVHKADNRRSKQYHNNLRLHKTNTIIDYNVDVSGKTVGPRLKNSRISKYLNVIFRRVDFRWLSDDNPNSVVIQLFPIADDLFTYIKQILYLCCHTPSPLVPS